jgi:hypothetical protein
MKTERGWNEVDTVEEISENIKSLQGKDLVCYWAEHGCNNNHNPKHKEIYKNIPKGIKEILVQKLKGNCQYFDPYLKEMSERDKEIKMMAEWKKEIFDKANEIDPHDEFTWSALAIGFFIGKGKSIAQARDLLREIEELKLI